jgi:hypothetical protein
MRFTFDWNEYFIIGAGMLFLSLFFPIRKYFHPVIVIIIWIYCIAYVETIDYFLIKSPYKLYYFGDNKTYQPSVAFIHLTFYPSASIIFLYIYDKWEFYGKKTIWYLVFWAGFSVFFEWLCLKNHVLHYTGWKLYYSIPTYPISAALLIILFKFIKKKLQDPIFTFSKKT